MSTQTLPALPGLGFPWSRMPTFQTRRQVSVSGKETRIADWSIPRYTWSLTYDVLRQGTYQGTWTEYTTLRGFFEQMYGGWDSFLYTDVDDNTVVGQAIATGDAATLAFPMVRTSGGFTVPTLAPNLSPTPPVIYLNGVAQMSGYSITPWGGSAPGILTFASAPGSGVAITADFSYYWPVRFDDDKMTFDKFMSNLYMLKKLSFTSIK